MISDDPIISYHDADEEDNEGMVASVVFRERISCFICTAELVVLFNDPTRLWLNPTTVFQKSLWHKATNFKALAGNRNLSRRKSGRLATENLNVVNLFQPGIKSLKLRLVPIHCTMFSAVL